MAPQSEWVVLQVATGSADREHVDRLALQLQTEIVEAGFAAERVPAESPPGSKAADAFALGALAIALLPALGPKLIEFLQAWTTRTHATVKLKLQRGDQSVELEFPPQITSEATLREYSRILGDALKSRMSGKSDR